MKFTSDKVGPGSFALLHSKESGKYALKVIEHISKYFQRITFKPEGGTRETYLAVLEAMVKSPMKHFSGEKSELNPEAMLIIAIGDGNTLNTLKDAYESVTSSANSMPAVDEPMEAVLLDMAKREPYNMSDQQLQHLKWVRLAPEELRDAANHLRVINSRHRAIFVPPGDTLCRESVRLQNISAYLYVGECLYVTFQDASEDPLPCWVVGGGEDHLRVSCMLGGDVCTREVAAIRSYPDNTFTFEMISGLEARSLQIKSFEVMPTVCARPITPPAPKVFIMSGGNWEEVCHAVGVSGPDGNGNVLISSSDGSRITTHCSQVRIEH